MEFWLIFGRFDLDVAKQVHILLRLRVSVFNDFKIKFFRSINSHDQCLFIVLNFSDRWYLESQRVNLKVEVIIFRFLEGIFYLFKHVFSFL